MDETRARNTQREFITTLYSQAVCWHPGLQAAASYARLDRNR